MNWNKILIRCSSLGCLFVEPKSKEDKLRGELSKTAKTHLIEVYAKSLYEVEKELDNKFVKKGNLAEEDSITLLTLVDGEFYQKNEERKSNEFIQGCCDIDQPEIIIDTKTSWDVYTFLPKLIESIDDDYEKQLQGYMWLYNKQRAKLSYCLVDTPQYLIDKEKWRLLNSMDVVTEESPLFQKAWEKKLRLLKPSEYMSERERVISKEILRDENTISQIPDKVKKAREFLVEFHALHLKQNLITVQ